VKRREETKSDATMNRCLTSLKEAGLIVRSSELYWASNADRQTPETAEGSRAHIPYNIMNLNSRTEQREKGNPPLGSGSPSPRLHNDEPETETGTLALKRGPRESEKAYAAFREYVALGPGRSLVLLAGKMGKRTRMVERWSVKHGWQARVAEHTAAVAELEGMVAQALVTAKVVDWAKRQEEQREEEWTVRCEVLVMAREAIQRWKNQPDRCGSLEGIARLLELASKLGRLASGMATDKTEVSAEVQAKLDVDWEIALKKVCGPEEPAGSVVDVEARVRTLS
jgi:hypothetical protein